MPAQWQLPAGVTRGLWEYIHDAELARAYDAHLADSPLSRIDVPFGARHVSQPGQLVDLGCGTGWLITDWLLSWLQWRAGGDHAAPAHHGLPGLTLHLFTRGEAVRLLKRAGFRVREIMPLSLRPDGRLPWPYWFAWLRAHGYLIA